MAIFAFRRFATRLRRHNCPQCGHPARQQHCDVCGYDVIAETRDKAIRSR